jgi:hypothetical protein
MIVSRESVSTPWQIRVPPDWVTKPLPEDLTDTRLPNKEYEIAGEVSVFIHSFPMHIPPAAQVERWKRQFDEEQKVSRVAFSGYLGLLFDARSKDQRVIAYALELPTRSSAITIKVVGPASLVDLHEEDIMRAARSFEAIP